MRTCTICLIEKEITEFNLRSRVTGNRTTICRPCENEKSRRNYEAKRAERIAKAKEWQAHQRALVRAFLWEHLLHHPCVDCGETDPRVLEFDHMRGEKEFNIAGSWSDTYRLDRVAEEVAKCDMRCANCHRKKTASDYAWWKDRWLKGEVA